MGLVRGAVCDYCLGGCSSLVVCARRSYPRCEHASLSGYNIPSSRGALLKLVAISPPGVVRGRFVGGHQWSTGM